MQRLHFELRYLVQRAPWDTGQPPPELLAYLEAHPPGRALDLGCGTGTNALEMARRGWQVTGVDFSRLAIGRARRRAGRAGLNVRFLQGDVTALDRLAPGFDLALDIGCFHSLSVPGQERYAAQAARLLRPGAALLLYGFAREQAPDPAGWLSEAGLRRCFGAAFTIAALARGEDRGRPSMWITLRRSG